MFNYADPAEGMAILDIGDEEFADQESPAWVVDNGLTRIPVIIEPAGPSDEKLAESARTEREILLRSIYDPGIMMALRALRMASTTEETDYAEGKIEELDNYAEVLIAIPDQAGFPQTIVWPTAPTK